jgi:hypothetical protein
MTADERRTWLESHDEDLHSMACLANAIVFALASLSLATLIYVIT